MKKLLSKALLTLQYILALLCCPKKVAEAVNEAQDVQDLDARIKRI